MRKWLTLCLVICLILPTTVVSAKTSQPAAKMYAPLHLGSEANKLPMKLSNGLVVDKEEPDGFGYLPVIKLNGKTVWREVDEAWINTGGMVQFAVTSGGDTYLLYKSGASGVSGVNLVGVHKNGKVFLKKGFGGIGTDAKFISANTIQIEIERENKKWNPDRDPNAARHTGIYDVTVYQLSDKGLAKQKQFVKK
ncbi:hypothetical protein [Paenibacillus sp.]|jgi:hypothetical protein|uniref:hypothetical protein n=1 Tax=Paenibacillus sp. TaxID=58172 RepID=UPI002816FE10|nr:hypothetical protein [Paenibacillus sp.]MDR0268162.1 hypothetical protein [Paenibacillus sp.]